MGEEEGFQEEIPEKPGQGGIRGHFGDEFAVDAAGKTRTSAIPKNRRESGTFAGEQLNNFRSKRGNVFGDNLHYDG